MKKKLGKQWGKIKLIETSAVGIPMYPEAINKSFRSLIKALKESEPKGEIKLEESPMGEDDAEKSEESSEEKSEESSEEKSEDSESETDTEDKPESDAESKPAESEEKSEEEVEKGISKEDMMDLMTKGFQAAIKASSTERGLIDNETQVEKMKGVLKDKSLGDLAIMNGMFKAPDMYGRII